MTSLISGIASVLVVSGMAFAYVDIGSPVPNPPQIGMDGVERSLVDSQAVTAFLFFHPKQEHSLEVLRALADLQKMMKDADIHWVGVVSDRFASEIVDAALAESGVDLETIIDEGDRLYGDLGVRLYPTIGIADSGGTLRAYLPYAKVNYMGALEAHLRHALGQIDDAALDLALHPTSADVSSQEAEVGRILKFARMLWDRDKRDKALAKAQEAVQTAPDLADPHALVGFFLVEMGNCDEGRTSLNRALEIDPDNTEALAALGKCDS